MTILFASLTWVLFSLLSGIIEAYLFYKYMARTDGWKVEKHIVFTFIRLIVATTLIVVFSVPVLLLAVFYFIFPFFHDGMLYVTINKLYGEEIYENGWFFDYSKTTSAVHEYTVRERVCMLFIGIIFGLLLYIGGL
jgi:hypothetical protein